MTSNAELMVSSCESNFMTTIYVTSEKGYVTQIDLTEEDVIKLIDMLTDKKVQHILDLKANGYTMEQINGRINK